MASNMPWFEDTKRTWLDSLVINILKTGEIPKHVAIIMDGNRRYAKQLQLDSIEGHSKGCDSLIKILGWLNDLGTTEVTVYAFSIENFKRPKDEVDGLMSMAYENIAKMLNEKDKLMEKDICVRLFGDNTLLPDNLKKVFAEISLLTINNKTCYLNFCFAYTARHEITRAVNQIKDGVKTGQLQSADIDEHLIQKCLFSRHSPDPDLLIRTSGEVRLSDFLLWQSSHTILEFTNVLWPAFTQWDLFKIIFKYQRHHPKALAAKQDYYQSIEVREKNRLERLHNSMDTTLSLVDFTKEMNDRQQRFIDNLEMSHLHQLRKTSTVL
ncbi:Dehydrodolichyl diphosphate synthase complex subunit DHDDS [Halotydeus destructor]|nr:Dehydrodolichyl diphosphate synthase complex subunit DHDDS [Halotydeus destructor]